MLTTEITDVIEKLVENKNDEMDMTEKIKQVAQQVNVNPHFLQVMHHKFIYLKTSFSNATKVNINHDFLQVMQYMLIQTSSR